MVRLEIDCNFRTKHKDLPSHSRKYRQITARDIRKGDIVEIQFNLTLMRVKSNVFVMKPILREIARFDDSLSLVSRQPKALYYIGINQPP